AVGGGGGRAGERCRGGSASTNVPTERRAPTASARKGRGRFRLVGWVVSTILTYVRPVWAHVCGLGQRKGKTAGETQTALTAPTRSTPHARARHGRRGLDRPWARADRPRAGRPHREAGSGR